MTGGGIGRKLERNESGTGWVGLAFGGNLENKAPCP